MIPVLRRHRSSHLSELPQQLCQSFSPMSMNSYETGSMTNCSLTPVTSTFEHSQQKQNDGFMCRTSSSDLLHQNRRKHDDTMQRYDRLLEKIRATDEQLQILSRSWTKNTHQEKSVSHNHTCCLLNK